MRISLKVAAFLTASALSLPLAANPVLDAATAPLELQQDANRSLDARRWRLDAAVFTEITPFTAPDIAIKLPADQREDSAPPPAAPPPAE